MLAIRLTIILLFIIVLHIYTLGFHRFSIFIKNYEILLNCNKRYTKEINKNNKIIHNFKNQLIVINGYVGEDNKKLKSYIYEIIKEQKEIKNDKLILELNFLPQPIKVLLFYKLSNVEDKINIEVNVNNSLNKLKRLTAKEKKNILCIIGILVDNAIEASINSKKKKLSLDFSLNKKTFYIEIKNSFKGEIDIKKINKKGYTTKGINRGYGLSIIEDIINKNSNMSIIYKIENGNFCVNFSVRL